MKSAGAHPSKALTAVQVRAAREPVLARRILVQPGRGVTVTASMGLAAAAEALELALKTPA